MSKAPPADKLFWFVRKAREQAEVSGTYRAARNLRKQGVPLDLAVSMLAVKLEWAL